MVETEMVWKEYMPETEMVCGKYTTKTETEKVCAFCGADSGDMVYLMDKNLFYITCDECGARSNKCESAGQAFDSWIRVGRLVNYPNSPQSNEE